MPDADMAYRVRADFYATAGEVDKAIADANQVIRLKPNDAAGYSDRAAYYFRKSDFDNVIADVTQAIRLNPDGAASDYWMRANTHNFRGDYVHAIEDATHAIETAPNIEQERLRLMVLRTSYSARAIARSNVGDLENALNDYNEAIKFNLNDADGYASRGQFYVWRKQYDLAIQDFDKALQLDPKEWISRSAKALALLRLGKIDEASQEVDAGLRLGSNRIP